MARQHRETKHWDIPTGTHTQEACQAVCALETSGHTHWQDTDPGTHQDAHAGPVTQPLHAKEWGSALCCPKPPPTALLGLGAKSGQGTADSPWTEGDIHSVSHSGQSAHPSGTAQPGLAAGQGFTKRLLFPAHSHPTPTHPPSLEKQIPTSCLFPNKLHVSTHHQTSPTRLAGSRHPTASRSKIWWDGQDPAGDSHVQSQ